MLPPEYLIIDTSHLTLPFRAQLRRLAGYIVPVHSERHRAMTDHYNAQRTGLYYADPLQFTEQQWYEELLAQILHIFDTHFMTYSEALKQLPEVNRLFYSKELHLNPVVEQELYDLFHQFAVSFYFVVYEHGYFPWLETVEYVLHHPLRDAIVLYSGREQRVHYI